MNHAKTSPSWRASVLILTAACFLLAGWSGEAQGVQHLSIIQEGGLPGLPVMTGIQQTTNGFKLTWDGPSGDYQVWHKVNLTNSSWLAVGGTNLSNTATLTNVNSSDFFRVTGPSPQYDGSQSCAICHGIIYNSQVNTPHAQAFAALQRIHQDTNPTCLPCHTVGFGLPTGFTSAAQTPQLGGVQCENCHGPAAVHAAIPRFSAAPRVDIAAQVCGGCHSVQLTPATVVAHHPMGFSFEDWSASPHGTVVPDALERMAASTNYISSCGRCHSGSAREALLEGENPSVTLTNDYDVAITCAVCHDPHENHVWTNVLYGVITFTNLLSPTQTPYTFTNNELGLVYTNQLRSPLASLQDYHASGDFATNYNADINLCAQCHNDRGASPADTRFPPHHSPQYNMLLGTVGVLADGTTPNFPSAHSRLEMQCAECHMQTGGDNASGHTFEVASYQVCLQCHPNPAALVQWVTDSVLNPNNMSNQIQQTKALLDMWATNAAPPELRTNYEALAWEYDNAGTLSNPEGLSTIRGPHADSDPALDQQKYIPDDIKNARFDLYLVYYDGSYGVHNVYYDIELLQSAQTFVSRQLPTNSLTLSAAASLQSFKKSLDSQLINQ